MNAARLSLATAMVTLLACCQSAPPPIPSAEETWHRGCAWLAQQQQSDGALRSDVYGILKPGWSTTALGLYAFALAPETERQRHASTIRRAFAFLREGMADDGSIGRGGEGVVDYPSYTAAFHILALAQLKPDGWRALTDRQVDYLRRVQCAARNGWSDMDAAYGGFGFGDPNEHKPFGAELVNLSITSHVIEALRAAGVSAQDPMIEAALSFVLRCRSTTGDGGFIFTPIRDAVMSKAGGAPPKSYTTTTADGIVAMMQCGLDYEDSRVVAAYRWMNPFGPSELELRGDEREDFEKALQCYERFAWARVLQQQPALVNFGKLNLHRWIRRIQRDDGSWIGRSPLMKEDDPLVATALSLCALGTR